jgi:uncharacterized protein YndB with AHSA1/START domain
MTTDTTANSTGTVTFHRVFKAPPERVYRAFLDPDALAKWLPPHGYVGRVLTMDATVGGHYRMQFTHLASGHTHAWGGTFVELQPHSRIVHTDRFDDPNLPGEMRTTVSLGRSRWAPSCRWCKRALLGSFLPKPAVWAGKTRCNC